jgi:hypothetical protein
MPIVGSFEWHQQMERALHRNLIIDKVQKLEKKERDIIRRAVGSCEYPDIISFLLQKCHVQDAESLSLDDIFAHCKQYLRKQHDRVKADLAGKKPAETVKRIIAALLISLLIICAFILSVWLIPFTSFTWVKNHPHSYGIQGSIICVIPCLIFGFFKPEWRKWCWGTAAIAFLVGLLSLL